MWIQPGYESNTQNFYGKFHYLKPNLYQEVQNYWVGRKDFVHLHWRLQYNVFNSANRFSKAHAILKLWIWDLRCQKIWKGGWFLIFIFSQLMYNVYKVTLPSWSADKPLNRRNHFKVLKDLVSLASDVSPLPRLQQDVALSTGSRCGDTTTSLSSQQPQIVSNFYYQPTVLNI